jgi:hypothetical protein
VGARVDAQARAVGADLVEGQLEEIAGEIPAGLAVQGEALEDLPEG